MSGQRRRKGRDEVEGGQEWREEEKGGVRDEVEGGKEGWAERRKDAQKDQHNK